MRFGCGDEEREGWWCRLRDFGWGWRVEFVGGSSGPAERVALFRRGENIGL